MLDFINCISLLPYTPLGTSNSSANKDMMSKILTNGETIILLRRKHCGKRRNCLLGAFLLFQQYFQKISVVDVSK